MTRPFYGAVGNGETVALISPTAQVDWLCAPRPDSFPAFARALDPNRGGCLTLSFKERGASVPLPIQGEWQRYRGRTNILETGLTAGNLSVSVVDFMPWGCRHLVRQIRVTNAGEAVCEVQVEGSLGVTYSCEAPVVLGERLFARFRGAQSARLAPGEVLETVLVLAYGECRSEASANWQAAGEADLAAEERFWAEWLAPARPIASGDRVLDEAYYRSLLALKLLCQERTGAILAAPTASFPAVPGGGDNWDYRYVWLRDGYFISRSLDAAGLHQESRRFYDFILALQGADGRWAQTLFTVDGGNPRECEVPDLAGPGGEKPVRLGNAASTQVQIDGEPSVLHGLWCHWQATGDERFIVDRWEHIRRAATAVMEGWRRQENGIWEIRERMDHWVYGKVLCAVGLRAAADMAGALGYNDLLLIWGQEAERIRVEVTEQGWSEARQAYRQTYDPASPLDISTLALSLWGLLPADDPRLTATVARMEEPLKRPDLPADVAYTTDTPFWGRKAGGLNIGGGMARYDYAAVPFYLPTLWLARHYRMAGDRERALALIRLCLGSATDLGLMAEHFDPATGEQWGNFPQGFSHEEMALALLELFGDPAW
ncbi:MAG: glycoside hydrolase family 15 protein [Mycobacterium leprae]